MAVNSGTIIALVVSLLLIGILMPIGLGYLLAFTSVNSTIQTLVSSVLPIIVAISVILGFIPKMRD